MLQTGKQIQKKNIYLIKIIDKSNKLLLQHVFITNK